MGRSVEALRRHYGTVEDPITLERMALAYSCERVAGWTRQRFEAARKSGKTTGFEASLLKLFNSDNAQALQNLSIDLEGLNGVAHPADDRRADASRRCSTTSSVSASSAFRENRRPTAAFRGGTYADREEQISLPTRCTLVAAISRGDPCSGLVSA
jgi:hypothetical protein